MSATSGVNVLRYSALGVGIFYGFYHQRTLSAAQKVAERQQEYEHKQTLINKAKEAYAKSKQPASATTGGLNQDPMDPKFDMESYFNALVEAKP
ncbi:ATP synthase E chain-domain-containing protein [Phialemonium atrogriseum]|uniref:ATP synthase F(0) complex subunit e, mitochondrial n=1 Tax=Phialemonium atrogriseum TaxID=1093897 RepID=A0AAJ0FJN6_9PEZI|nr:ATP synthase E chain-domain-containing protein [Phialemonium atrogriseum]KAK1764639.1 ATP synthase E chain-domain-containing protein [Phialemonium atrogriseum]